MKVFLLRVDNANTLILETFARETLLARKKNHEISKISFCKWRILGNWGRGEGRGAWPFLVFPGNICFFLQFYTALASRLIRNIIPLRIWSNVHLTRYTLFFISTTKFDLSLTVAWFLTKSEENSVTPPPKLCNKNTFQDEFFHLHYSYKFSSIFRVSSEITVKSRPRVAYRVFLIQKSV